ncbi:nitrous oxide reductase accessory protein NosL [uncultured Brevibacillus sp.]|uniref:nitrous oxide reductase accessory protein NosL n=1 Tax=uncultured Brevibacillus sp. TaxID=169970 RepID=UPI00259500EB|nr:nitrous oxide reductase accessory protein NosL [uncultured Brevibacillus sp.]
MKKWITTVGVIVGISLMMIGCGKQEAQPAEIAAGVDKCDICHMQVPNDHNATQIVLKDGKVLKFDDIGCMHEWTEKNGTETVDVQFVRDYYTAEWMKADQAAYAYDATFKTPMSYGIHSFKDKAAAESFVQEQKKGVVTDLKDHAWERSMSGHMNKDGHSSGEHQQQDGHSTEGHSEGTPAADSNTQSKH